MITSLKLQNVTSMQHTVFNILYMFGNLATTNKGTVPNPLNGGPPLLRTNPHDRTGGVLYHNGTVWY